MHVYVTCVTWPEDNVLRVTVLTLGYGFQQFGTANNGMITQRFSVPNPLKMSTYICDGSIQARDG